MLTSVSRPTFTRFDLEVTHAVFMLSTDLVRVCVFFLLETTAQNAITEGNRRSMKEGVRFAHKLPHQTPHTAHSTSVRIGVGWFNGSVPVRSSCVRR